ncbi:MAG: hypothetical protein AAGD06_17270 [Acidobacteriota bacterium]
MQTFFETATSLPTVVFTVPLLLVILNWAIALLSGIDLDILDGVEATTEGAAEGLAEGLSEGLSEGAAEGLGGIEGAVEVDGGGDGGSSFFADAGFGDVPRSISWSLMIVFAWTFSLLGTLYVPGFEAVATGALWLSLAAAAGTFVLAVAATALAIQPLRRMLMAGFGPHRHDLVGQTCLIKTGRVDDAFGQAEVAGGVIQVRHAEGFSAAAGTRALIYDYDDAREVFLVEPLDDI